jgi:hypothetical protein
VPGTSFQEENVKIILALMVALASGCAARAVWHEPTVYQVWTSDRLSECPEDSDEIPMPTTAAVAVSDRYAVAPIGGAGWLQHDFSADASVTLFNGEWRTGEIVAMDRKENFVLIRLDQPSNFVLFAPPSTDAPYRNVRVDWEDGLFFFQFDAGGRLMRIEADGLQVLYAEMIVVLSSDYFASWGRHADEKPDWNESPAP